MINRNLIMLITFIIMSISIVGCGENQLSTKNIFVTSESGEKIAPMKNVYFSEGEPQGATIVINPEKIKQTIDGIGTSFTESSAFVLAHLDPDQRRKVMENIFSSNGANFSLTRTHIGSCDFSVEGKYSYADQKDDKELNSFSILPDKAGFSKQKYQGIVDEKYDLLPMIKEALEIKNKQSDNELRIIASAWTAPFWMKDIEDWFIKGNAENNYQGTGGKLKPEYEETYAKYLVKYLNAYRNEGVNIWGLTPVNEPHGNNGQWESMHFTPKTQNRFIKNYLGPYLIKSENKNVNLLIYDQNRDGLKEWADEILGDSETSKYIYGSAVHWYASTYKVYEDVFEEVNSKYPKHAIIHTEGCIDDLGKPAPEGIGDPENFQEENWFNNDQFWWNKNATDWAYTAPWAGENVDDHPMYTPVHRYARNIIVSIDHWVRGWVDWNIVLDHKGGPNHVGNYCGAPIMIDTENKFVYYTPVFYVLSQLSRTIRPGDKAVQTTKILNGFGEDDIHACATINNDNVLSIQILNTTKQSKKINIKIKDRFAELSLKENSLTTVQVQL